MTGRQGIVKCDIVCFELLLVCECDLDEFDHTVDGRDQYSFLTECGFVAVSNLLKLSGHHLYITSGNVNIKNLGQFLLTFPETYAINDSTELKHGSDELTSEMIEHGISNLTSVGNVATHRHFESDRVHLFVVC